MLGGFCFSLQSSVFVYGIPGRRDVADRKIFLQQTLLRAAQVAHGSMSATETTLPFEGQGIVFMLSLIHPLHGD